MKRLFFYLLAITFFSACKNENGTFTVSGKIKMAEADSVYLEQLSYDTPDMKIVDSAKLGSDGTYKLKAVSAQQNLYVISLKNNPAIIMINDAGDIKINFDNSNVRNPEINGSDATKELYKFIHTYLQSDSMLALTYSQMSAMSQQQHSDTNALKSIQLQYTKQLNNLSDVLRNFINTSKNPAAICFALDKAKGALAHNELQLMIDNAVKRFPQHTGISAFKTAFAKGQQKHQDQENPNANYALLNQQAPDLTMQSTTGKTMHISDFKGKYLLVDFWASWCGPCRQENPNVVAAYNKFRNKNFTILGVSLDESKQAWTDAIKKDNLNWNQMSDLKQWESAAIAAYQFDGIPFNVLIDPNGKIIAAGLRGEALVQKLTEVVQ